MKYIKISNDGVLDVATACSMLGASVKINEDAIGVFGSGLKYALAQACRMNVDIHIASGENVFHVETKEKEFRGEIFDKVVLRDIFTDEIKETPITTNYGSQDWDDLWYIYREIICNSIDENNHRKVIVTNLRRCKNETAIYLEYEQFKNFFDNQNEYITKKSNGWIKPGTGIIFKRGIRVGVFDKINLNWQNNYVAISESRQVNEWDSFYRLGQDLSSCIDAKIWESFVLSEDFKKVTINILSKTVGKAFNLGCKRAFGDYAICPNVEQIKKDLQTIGCYPFVVPNEWVLPDNIPSFENKISLTHNDEIRAPKEHEKALLKWGFNLLNQFDIKTDANVMIFKSEKLISGLKRNNVVFIKEMLFNDKKKLLSTLLHEFGHINSEAGDYDREFTNYFTDKIIDFIME